MQFASFTLDLDRLCLFGPAGKAALRPKSFEVLRYLIERAGRVVGKEEIIRAVWPHVVVTDESLTRCISDIRRALGDADQQLIKTVPRRGYLIDIPIAAADATAAATLGAADARTEVPSARTQHVTSNGAQQIESELTTGERKQVTVLCADLKESLERVAQRDPEEALKIFEGILPLMTQAVERYGGTINVVTTEGIMALFGAPLAYEDHAVRACYAALELQETVKREAEGFRRQPSIPIVVRAGLSSGEMVIRSIGKGSHVRCRVMGEAANLAARLAQIAPPGSSLLTAGTLRAAEGHLDVKMIDTLRTGRSDYPVFELVGAGRAQTRFQVLAARGLTGFVGRGLEMDQLERLCNRAEQRHGQVVTIIGEPGVGKSRLIQEFIRANHSPRRLVLETASVSHRRATNYQAVIDLLKDYFKIEGSDGAGKLREKIAGRLQDLDRELASDLPALLALLDIPVEEAWWNALESSQRRRRTLDAVKRLLLRECQQQLVILAFEDLHWIDSESQALLDILIDSLPAARLLLLLTYRPEYEHQWGRKSYYTQLRLDTLSPETTEKFLSNLLGDDESLVGLKQLLSTQGNPFFLEESVRSLVETRILEGKRGAYRLIGALPELRIPATVQVILAARIDRLPAGAKKLLHAASVIGKNVPFSILRAIAGLPDDELRRELAELAEAELLYEGQQFPVLEYTFKHALTHNVAYGSLLADERIVLHRQVVDTIERLYPDRLTEYVEQLAHHALRGDLREKAVHYLRQSGRKSAARSALQDARSWFEQALSLLDELPQTPSTLEQAFEMRLELRPVLNMLGELPDVLKRLEETVTLAERLNDDRRRGQVYAFATNAHSLSGELDKALVKGGRALQVARQLGDLQLRVLTTTYLEQAHYFQGDYRRVVELATRNISGLPPDWEHEFLGNAAPASVYDRHWLIMSLAQLGRFDEGIEHETRAICIAEKLHHAHTLGVAYRASAILYLTRGDWERARAPAEHTAAALRAGHVNLLLPEAVAVFAWVLGQLGDTSRALDLVLEAEQLLQPQAARMYVGRLGWAYCALGRACLLLDRIPQAQRFAQQAVECSPHQPGYAAHAIHLLGEIWTRAEPADSERGEACYRQALALAEPRSMSPLIAHCHRGLGHLYGRTGRHQEADKHHATAATMYRDLGMYFWLANSGPARLTLQPDRLSSKPKPNGVATSR